MAAAGVSLTQCYHHLVCVDDLPRNLHTLPSGNDIPNAQAAILHGTDLYITGVYQCAAHELADSRVRSRLLSSKRALLAQQTATKVCDDYLKDNFHRVVTAIEAKRSDVKGGLREDKEALISRKAGAKSRMKDAKDNEGRADAAVDYRVGSMASYRQAAAIADDYEAHYRNILKSIESINNFDDGYLQQLNTTEMKQKEQINNYLDNAKQALELHQETQRILGADDSKQEELDESYLLWSETDYDSQLIFDEHEDDSAEISLELAQKTAGAVKTAVLALIERHLRTVESTSNVWEMIKHTQSIRHISSRWNFNQLRAPMLYAVFVGDILKYIGKTKIGGSRFQGGHMALVKALAPAYRNKSVSMEFYTINVDQSGIPLEWYNATVQAALLGDAEQLLINWFQPEFNAADEDKTQLKGDSKVVAHHKVQIMVSSGLLDSYQRDTANLRGCEPCDHDQCQYHAIRHIPVAGVEAPENECCRKHIERSVNGDNNDSDTQCEDEADDYS